MLDENKTPQNKDQSADIERRVDAMMDIKPSAPLVEGMEDDLEVIAEKTVDASETVPVETTVSEAEPETLKTDEIVDDILKRESDELLVARDAHNAEISAPQPKSIGWKAAVARFFAGWWNSKLARYGTLFIVLAALGGLTAIPTSRYLVLNTVGVRSAASLTILDNTTQLPLKNVTIELGDIKSKTNQDGAVTLKELKLGTQSLTVSQAGFATISKTVTLGFGSNPLGDFTLDAVGKQFRFKLVDYLTGKPVTAASISSGDANAKADAKGQLVLTIAQDAEVGSSARIAADGYRTETLDLETTDGQPSKQNRSIVMVPSQKDVFVSKQTGKFDLYKMDIDGMNKQVLLAASGHEDEDIAVTSSPDGAQAAMVSRRDTTRNQDNYPLQTLSIVDVETSAVLTLDRSERIQIVNWTTNRLVYVKIKAGTSAGNPERFQLMSYDYEKSSRLQLATANAFNDVLTVGDTVYYASSNDYQGGVSQFVRINPDSTGKQVLLDKMNVWNVVRTDYGTLELAVLDATYQYKIGDPAAQKVTDGSGLAPETKYYLDVSGDNYALWTDTRDGKGVLLVHNSETRKDNLLASQSGLSYPVRWLNKRTIIYRVATATETADYVVSLDGGTAKKVTDLTNTTGIGRWNYR